MIELRCSSLALALALGAHVPGTRRHAAFDDETMIRIYYSELTPPLYWRWQLGRLERALARRSGPQGD
jgi:hypothetical protein